MTDHAASAARGARAVPVLPVDDAADTAPEALARARAAGLPLLHKPLRPAKLRALLHRMLGAARASGLQQ